MARLNEILVGRFNKGLQRVFGIKGGPPVATLAPEVMPTVTIASGVETRYLEAWNRYSMSVLLTGGAAANAGIQLRNPPGSGLIAVVEQISFTVTIATEVIITTAAQIGDLTTAQTPVSLDGRNTASSALVVTSSVATPGTLASQTLRLNIGSVNTPYWLIQDQNHELPITPGITFRLTQTTNVDTIDVNFMWRERYLEESERL